MVRDWTLASLHRLAVFALAGVRRAHYGEAAMIACIRVAAGIARGFGL